MTSPAARNCFRTRATGYDYTRTGKPDIAWDDQDAKDGLVSALVTDALALLAAVDPETLEGKAADAYALLALVAGQDVEPADGFGRDRRAVADRPQGRPGPGDLHRGPRCPARAQDPVPAAGRIQGPHRHRTRHRADHRRGADQGLRAGEQ